MENVIKTQKADIYTFELYKRENLTRFTKCPFAVLYKKETPKGKYSNFKVIEHVVFDTIEKAEVYINKLIDLIEKRAQERKEAKEAYKKANNDLKASQFYTVGDIIYNSWGYEQTNINYYQVIKVTDKKIMIEEIEQQQVTRSLYSHGMACLVEPIKNAFINNKNGSFMLTVRPGGSLIGGASCFHFSKYDGRPKYCSWYY
jgi:hypothetical protein